MTVDEIKRMTYTQFVAYIDQWNAPPGALDTINQWSVFGHVCSKSNILEIGCSTGISGREIARMTGCSSIGIDICQTAIESAMLNAEIYGKGLNLKYICGDACEFTTDEKFSHIIVGASLGFFKEPQKMLNRICSFFADSGYLLASPYYSTCEIPNGLKKECQRVIGITEPSAHYNSIRNMYANFELAYEKRCTIVLETKEQIEKNTRDTIQRVCELRKIINEDVKKAMYDRFYEIKVIKNELHKYQAYSVLVLRYLKEVYPYHLLDLY